MATTDYSAGTIASINDVIEFIPSGPMGLTISGTWSGTIILRYSSDNRSTWRTASTYTSNPSTGTDYIPAARGAGKIWQVVPTSWSSGSASVELGHL